ncbi:MAG: carbonic anhydrase [Bryobacteraceae bacterium]
MRRLFWFPTPRETYRAAACAIGCFDARFELAVRKFLRRRAGQWVDHVKLAGGVRALASPVEDWEREFALRQVRAAAFLHGAEHVILMAHADCAAYGGLAAFQGDEAREAAHHRRELERAAAAVAESFPGMAVERLYLNFEGVWEADDTVEHSAREY